MKIYSNKLVLEPFARFKGSPPVLIFDGLFIISWRFLIVLILLIIFGPYIMSLSHVIMEKSGSELALESTLRKNYENFRLLKVVEWG